MEHIAQQGVDVGGQQRVGVFVDALGTALQDAYGLGVLSLAVVGFALVVVEGDLGGVVELTVAAYLQHAVHVAALQHDLENLQARLRVVGLDFEHTVEHLEHGVGGHVALGHVVGTQLGHVAAFLWLRQDLGKEAEYGCRIGPGLDVVDGVGAHGLDAGRALGAGIEHHAVEQVEVERVGSGRLVVGQERDLRIAVVGLDGQHVAVDVEGGTHIVVGGAAVDFHFAHVG